MKRPKVHQHSSSLINLLTVSIKPVWETKTVNSCTQFYSYLSRRPSLSSLPDGSMNGVIELELKVRIVLLLQASKFLKSPRFPAIDCFQRLITMCVVDVCGFRASRHLPVFNQSDGFFGPGVGFVFHSRSLSPPR